MSERLDEIIEINKLLKAEKANASPKKNATINASPKKNATINASPKKNATITSKIINASPKNNATITSKTIIASPENNASISSKNTNEEQSKSITTQEITKNMLKTSKRNRQTAKVINIDNELEEPPIKFSTTEFVKHIAKTKNQRSNENNNNQQSTEIVNNQQQKPQTPNHFSSFDIVEFEKLSSLNEVSKFVFDFITSKQGSSRKIWKNFFDWAQSPHKITGFSEEDSQMV